MKINVNLQQVPLLTSDFALDIVPIGEGFVYGHYMRIPYQ